LARLVSARRSQTRRSAVIELGLTGAKFAPPSPPEQVASPPGRALQLPGSHPATPPQEGSSRIQQYVASIRAFISDDQLDFAAQRVRADVNQVGSNPTDQVEALIYTVALLNIQIAHERNYNAIYGSQLRLLAQMTSAVGASPAVA
jgi:hypothetical protein